MCQHIGDPGVHTLEDEREREALLTIYREAIILRKGRGYRTADNRKDVEV